MLRPYCLCLALLLCSATAPFAVAQADPQKEADIRELIVITGGAELGLQFAEQLMAQMEPLLRQAFPSVPSEVMSDLLSEMRAELQGAQAELVEMVVPIYDRHLSADEIAGLLAFYRTPLGQRVIETLPAVMQESMAAGSEWGERSSQAAVERVIAKLQAGGYAIE